jgi:hypothetical protein
MKKNAKPNENLQDMEIPFKKKIEERISPMAKFVYLGV